MVPLPAPPPRHFLPLRGTFFAVGRGGSPPHPGTLSMSCSIYLLLRNQSPNNSSSKQQHSSPDLLVSVVQERGKRSAGRFWLRGLGLQLARGWACSWHGAAASECFQQDPVILSLAPGLVPPLLSRGFVSNLGHLISHLDEQ